MKVDVAGQIRTWLASPVPRVDAPEAERIALSLFGVRAVARPLVAERDRSFRLDTGEGPVAVLKIHTSDAERAALDFQNAALDHIAERAPKLPVPRVLRARDGATLLRWKSAAGTRHWVRLLSWQAGTVADFSQAGNSLREATGGLLARLQEALSEAPLTGAPTALPWDLQNMAELADFSVAVPDTELRRLAERSCSRFTDELQPGLADLPLQVVHNDFNADNILVDDADPPGVCGVIDFGDMAVAPRLVDLAIACSYQVEPGEDPLSGPLALLRGYCSVAPFPPGTAEGLLGLLECRLATSVLIQFHRVLLHPDNRAYFENGLASTAARLRCFQGLSGESAARRVREVVASAEHPQKP